MKARLPRCGSIHEQGAAIVTDNSKSYPSIQREGVVGVIQQEERFLVIRRSAHVVAPGKLCFPGGGIEAGESQPVALCRELMEEIAVENSGRALVDQIPEFIGGQQSLREMRHHVRIRKKSKAFSG